MDIFEAAKIITAFEESSLGKKLASLEDQLIGQAQKETKSFCQDNGLNEKLLEASFKIKSLAGQINVIIHAAGILCALPYILDEDGGEVVEYISLGAGNTGKKFDLETNRRIAEFKFINWHGGPESIRQNSLFKDFYYLAAGPKQKKKFMYLLSLEEPLKFFNGRRNLNSVLSKNIAFRDYFLSQHQGKFKVVCDYFKEYSKEVEIVDLRLLVPQLSGIEGLL